MTDSVEVDAKTSELKEEWGRLDDLPKVMTRRLGQRDIRAFLAFFFALYLVDLALGGIDYPQLVVGPPVWMVMALLADTSVKRSEFSWESSENPGSESLVLLTVSGLGTIVIVTAVTELGPTTGFVEALMKWMIPSVGLWFATVIPVVALAYTKSYDLYHFGLTMKSISSAWFLLISCTLVMVCWLPMAWTREGAGLPLEVLLLGTAVQASMELTLVAMPEELLFRGAIQNRFIALSESNTRGVILSSLVFALFHIPRHLIYGESFGAIPALAIIGSILLYTPAGIMFGIMTLRTGSLKWSTVCHTLLNTGQSVFTGLLVALFLLA